MKKFVLTVQYTTGEISLLVDTPDLLQALKIFEDTVFENTLYTDKSTPRPDIKSASISPLWYETKYKGEKDNE